MFFHNKASCTQSLEGADQTWRWILAIKDDPGWNILFFFQDNGFRRTAPPWLRLQFLDNLISPVSVVAYSTVLCKTATNKATPSRQTILLKHWKFLLSITAYNYAGDTDSLCFLSSGPAAMIKICKRKSLSWIKFSSTWTILFWANPCLHLLNHQDLNSGPASTKPVNKGFARFSLVRQPFSTKRVRGSWWSTDQSKRSDKTAIKSPTGLLAFHPDNFHDAPFRIGNLHGLSFQNLHL